MKDVVVAEKQPISIPAGVGWEIMRKLVEADKLLKTGRDMRDVRDPAREILNAAAVQLSYVLMPEFGAEMADAGMRERHEEPAGGASP